MPVVSNRTRKLQREKSQREALIRSLTISLIENRSIETTLPKAKTVRPFAEKLITKAKVGDLHNRRQIIARLHSSDAASILIEEITPNLNDRTSGYLRITRTRLRRGDNAQLAKLSFVDDTTKKSAVTEKKSEAKKSSPKTSATKGTKATSTKSTTKAKTTTKKAESK